MLRVGLALAAILGASSSAWAGEAEIAFFEADYPDAARRLEERYSQCKGAIRFEETFPSRPVPGRRVGAGDFAIDQGREKISFTSPMQFEGKTLELERVYCINEESSFQLSRDAEDKPYRVEAVGADVVRKYKMRFGRILKASFAIHGVPLHRIMANSPHFRVLDATWSDTDGQNLLRVEYENGDTIKQNVVVVLDPEGGWVIRSFEESNNVRAVPTSVEVQYGGTPLDGTFFPEHVTWRDGSQLVSECEFSDWSLESTPLSEFTMAHFDMPEIVSGIDKPRGAPYWIAGIAVACLAIAVILIWVSMSRTKSPGQT